MCWRSAELLGVAVFVAGLAGACDRGPAEASSVSATPTLVRAQPRRYGRLEVALGREQMVHDPFAICVDGSGRRVVVVGLDGAVLSSPRGVHRIYREGAPLSCRIWRDGVIYGATMYDWTAKRGRALPYDRIFDNEGASQIASRYVRSWWTVVAQDDGARQAPAVLVRAARDTGGERRERRRYKVRLEGYGTAAIDDEGRVAVAMEDGNFSVYEAEPAPGTKEAVVSVSVDLGREPYAVGVTDSGFAVLVADDADPAAPAMRQRLRRFHPDHGDDLLLRWSSSLVLLDDRGTVRSRVALPFEGRQPPIAGQGNRLYVFGRGVIALDGSKVAWARPIDAWCRGAVFSDDTVVAACDDTVRVFDEDGNERVASRTPDGSTLRTAPAVAADGTVFVASSTGLFVAR